MNCSAKVDAQSASSADKIMDESAQRRVTMQPRNVAFVGAICVTIGWLVASTVTPPVARVQTRPPERAKPADELEAIAFNARVQLQERELPPPPQGRRNPFAFAPRTPVNSDSAPEIAREGPPPPDAAPIPAMPAYSVAGIAISGDTTSAVLSSGADVHIVKVNDVIGGYTVVEITESSVTLASGTDRFILQFAK
jgi:hypothetical protein